MNNRIKHLKPVPNVNPAKACCMYDEAPEFELELNNRENKLSAKFLDLFLHNYGGNDDLAKMGELLRGEIDENTAYLIDFIHTLMESADWRKRYRAVVDKSIKHENDYRHATYELGQAQIKAKQAKKELDDVRAQTRAHLSERDYKMGQMKKGSKIIQSEIAKKNRRVCYVYIMKTHHNSSIKIGMSNTPKKREATLRSDEDLYLYETKSFKNRAKALKAEASLHSFFDKYRLRGEWFDLPEDIINSGLDGMLNLITE